MNVNLITSDKAVKDSSSFSPCILPSVSGLNASCPGSISRFSDHISLSIHLPQPPLGKVPRKKSPMDVRIETQTVRANIIVSQQINCSMLFNTKHLSYSDITIIFCQNCHLPNKLLVVYFSYRRSNKTVIIFMDKLDTSLRVSNTVSGNW